MGVLSCTISGIPYLVKNDKSIMGDRTLEVRGVLTVTIIDLAGAFTFQRGQPIVVSDSDTGPFYRGFIQGDQRMKYGPASAAVDHVLTCFDRGKYLFDKGANTKNYAGWRAGDVVVDFVQNGQPGQEGATVAAGLHRDSTQADFNTGILTNTVGALNVDDGDLELAPAGSAVTYSEETMADFATGTLTNVVALPNNTLVPTSVNAIKMVAEQTLAGTNSVDAVSSVLVWQGTQNVSASGQTWIEYDMFIDPAAPEAKMAVDILFSDGSLFSAVANAFGANEDGQFILPDAGNDLAGLATTAWYHRKMSITTGSGWSGAGGLSVKAISVVCKGTRPGVYTGYFKNIVLTGTTTATFFNGTLNVNPPQQLQSYGFSSTSVSVVPTCDLYVSTAPTYGATAYKTTTSISLSAVNLLKSSYLSWVVIEPTNTKLAVAYSLDGGNSYTSCTNGAALPNLPAGLSLTGKSLLLQYQFYYLEGALPDTFPILESVSLTVQPAAAATKSDVTYIAATSSDWNAGTLTDLKTSAGGELMMNGIIRLWDDGSDAGQTLYSTSIGGTGFFQSANNRSMMFWNIPSGIIEARSRFDFAGNTWQNFIAEMDIKMQTDFWTGFVYRTTGWQNNNDTYAYTLWLADTALEIQKGTNSASGAGSPSTVSSVGATVGDGTWHRLRIVVSGTTHDAYLDGVRLIHVTDATYTAAGYFGARVVYFGSGSGLTSFYDNFGIVSALSGTWVSPSTSLTSIGTYGNSIISWLDKSPSYNGLTNTSIKVEVTYNGGTTYFTCTNGAPLPGLVAGQSLSGINMQFRITLASTSASSLAAVDNLIVRVMGQYSSSGTRSTKPLGIDYIDRADQSGLGTASDGQVWTPIGTATAAVTSNTLAISNTTGDFFEQLGSRTDDDMDMTVPFMLSSSAITAGMTLRYVDANNHYKLQASTTSIDIVKKVSGVSYTLVSVPSTLTINTLYYMCFRVVNQMPVDLYGRIWLAGTLEDQENWTISTSD
jgi:hypothetical protein